MVDNMTPAQRRATMSKIRGRDTQLELAVRRELHRRGHRYRVHVAWLPGKPDIVFTRVKLVVFVDGDFWHGWQFDVTTGQNCLNQKIAHKCFPTRVEGPDVFVELP